MCVSNCRACTALFDSFSRIVSQRHFFSLKLSQTAKMVQKINPNVVECDSVEFLAFAWFIKESGNARMTVDATAMQAWLQRLLSAHHLAIGYQRGGGAKNKNKAKPVGGVGPSVSGGSGVAVSAGGPGKSTYAMVAGPSGASQPTAGVTKYVPTWRSNEKHIISLGRTLKFTSRKCLLRSLKKRKKAKVLRWRPRPKSKRCVRRLRPSRQPCSHQSKKTLRGY